LAQQLGAAAQQLGAAAQQVFSQHEGAAQFSLPQQFRPSMRSSNSAPKLCPQRPALRTSAPSTNFHFIEQPLLLGVEPRAFVGPAPQADASVKAASERVGCPFRSVEPAFASLSLESSDWTNFGRGNAGWNARGSNDVVRQGRRTNPWSE
jgi:hypothetical protein